MTETGPAVAMAAVQFQRGDATAAAELLGPVLVAEPDNVRALVLMTHAQLALKQPELAYQAAHRAALVAPESAEALGALSRAFTGLDRHDEAIEVARRAVELEPENAYRHNRMAWALLGDGRRAVEAEHAARLAVQLDPNEADFRITYAVVMKQLTYTDRARQALRDALALEPDNAVAQHELATLDVVHRNPFALGRLARGAAGLAGALRADPRQQASRFMLDVALRRFLVYTAVLLAVLAYVGWRMADFSVGGARVLAGAAALAPIGFATYFVTRLDRSLRTYLMTVVTQGRQRIAAIGAALCLALLLAATVAPAGWLPWLLGVAAIGGFAVRLLTVSASNAHVRSAGVKLAVDRVSIVLWWVVIGCVVVAIVLELGVTDPAWWLSVIALLLVLAAGVCLAVLVRRRRAGHRRFRGISS
ncbi:UDP-N-acetylglucosamine-peptide N-acetylglucosaminyltransferase [Actinoplanes sp. KI2]|uniref:UDP-N-acetylglucosamine-peptide N-acetylglucosaminyltransferase n=1 Tax=Actinoplanes sp. KI2 TaxID=2983315 RepID=UPI0021D5DE22|nr:UDP-N-acetylglucosamine-peptide N-acetylglucosaminyltransferase [Actinoplanes sp. KI2]MCU7731053.1 UDP-N-acetylglucosamine-peptide N-acetylglucosaminyltransferase [Actinoplanes sp. KI2]